MPHSAIEARPNEAPPISIPRRAHDRGSDRIARSLCRRGAYFGGWSKPGADAQFQAARATCAHRYRAHSGPGRHHRWPAGDPGGNDPPALGRRVPHCADRIAVAARGLALGRSSADPLTRHHRWLDRSRRPERRDPARAAGKRWQRHRTRSARHARYCGRRPV